MLSAQGLGNLKAQIVGSDAIGFQARRDVLKETLIFQCGDRQVEAETGGLQAPGGAVGSEPGKELLERQSVHRSGSAIGLPVGNARDYLKATCAATGAQL